MEFLLAFVCCLVLAVSVIGMMKFSRETTGHQRQQDIINVAGNIFVLIRQGDMKKCNVVQMTSFLLNLSKSTILKYYKKSVDEVSTPGKTRKKKPQEGKSVDTIDSFTMNAIRNAICRMYSEGQHVTVETILKEIQKRQIDFYGGRTTLYKLLKKMEFSWTTVDGRKAMIENENIVLQRIDFLRKYKEAKEKGANFIFVDETWIYQKGTAMKAWHDGTPQTMKRRSVGEGKRFIVVNAGGRSGFVPEAGLLFVSGQNTADYHGEMNGETFLKWLEDMLVHLEEPSIIIMDNASYHSMQTEKAPTTSWSKGEIIEWLEKRNIEHQKNLLKLELLRLAKANKPEIRWNNCVDHVEKLINADWEREVHVDIGLIPPLIVHLNRESDSEESGTTNDEAGEEDREVLAIPLEDLPGCSN